MTPHWHRLQDLFESASALPPDQRSAFLHAACDADDRLRAEVESLLSVGAESSRFLETPVLELSAALPAAIAAGAMLPDPLIGQHVGAYRVVRRIGTGGMGVVYLAEQLNPRRVVALKVIRPGIASAQVLRRFEHEARVLGRLHHVGIAHIHEAGTARTPLGVQPFFAMEYVVGEPLLQYIERRRLGVRERLALLIRVCDAVQHAHSKGVIHRDIKPANILVEEASLREMAATTDATRLATDVGQPKILDFGVARVTDTDPQNASMRTEVGQLVGTLAYMSPEQVTPPAAASDHAPGAADPIDTRSDVYALGVLAYEALTGALPYQVSGKPIHEAARAICESPPVRPGAIDRSLRGDIETVLLKALEKDPGRRYQSAVALGDDLRRVLLDQPILARPASATYQLRKLVARHKLPTAALAAVFLLITGFGIWMSVLYARAERLRTEAQTAWTAESVALRKTREAERLATRRAETASKVLEVLVDAFRAVDPALSQSADINARDVIAREIVDRGIRKIEHDLGDEPHIRAHLQAILGGTLAGLGQLDRAAALLQEAIQTRRAESKPPPELVADYLDALSDCYKLMGRADDARETAAEALAIYRARLPEHAPKVADALKSLALIYIADGRVDEAERLCLESIRLHRQTPGHEGRVVAESFNVLAGALAERGNYARAEQVLRRALQMVREETVIESDRTESSLRANLAWVLCMQGRAEESEPEARWALESRLKQFASGHVRTSPPLLTLGLVLTRLGRPEEGEPYIRECLEIRRRATPGAAVAIGEAGSALGECLAEQGQHEDAELLLLTSLRAIQAGSDASLETAQLALQRIVRLYDNTGDATRAGEYLALLRPPWDAPWVSASEPPH